MQRYLYTFLRFIAVLIIPLIVGSIVGMAILLSNTTYTATSNLWVQTSLYSDPQQLNQGSSYNSPAKQFGDQLTELLSTRNFVGSLIDGTELKNTVKTDAERLNLIDDLSKNIKIEASGWSLIRISYSDKSPETSLSVISSTVSTFIGYYNSNISQQENTANRYYAGLVKTSKAELDKATKALEDFLAANPNKIGSEGAAKAVTQEDIQYGLLTQNRDVARKTYDEAVANLDKTKNNFGALQQGQGTTLTIKDQPQVSDNKTSKVRQIALGLGLGLVVGAIISGLITVLLTLLDNKLRLVSRAQQVLRVRRVFELPNVRRKKRQPKTTQTPASPGPAHNMAADFLAVHSRKLSPDMAVKAVTPAVPAYAAPNPKTYVKAGANLKTANNPLIASQPEQIATLTIEKPALMAGRTLGETTAQSELRLGLGLMASGFKTVLLTILDSKNKGQPTKNQAIPKPGVAEPVRITTSGGVSSTYRRSPKRK